jgi:RNA polymerase sigma-70 factor (ECF subfamily)
MGGINGEAIQRGALSGEAEARRAFQELWEFYYSRLLSYAAAFKQLPPSDYGDLSAEALIRAFQKIEQYDPAYSLSTWVYTIARNYFNDILRGMKKTDTVSLDTVDETDLIDHGGSNIADEVVTADLVDRCNRAIETLRDGDKRIVFLKYFEGLTSEEIGLAEGMSPGTVRWRVSVIKACLVKKIGGR